MKVGITGHQKRKGIQWSWVREVICAELHRVGNVTQALSSLAAGSDQVFAEEALGLGIPVTAVIPLECYERFFEGPTLTTYQRLVGQGAVAKVVEIGWWRSLWFVQRTISGVRAPVETTPWKRITQ